MYDYNASAKRDWRDEGICRETMTRSGRKRTAARTEENRHSLWSFLVCAVPLAVIAGLVVGVLPTGGTAVFLWFGCLGFLLSQILSN